MKNKILELTTSGVKAFAKPKQRELIKLLLDIVEMQHYSACIDGEELKSRDDVFDWQIDKNIGF